MSVTAAKSRACAPCLEKQLAVAKRENTGFSGSLWRRPWLHSYQHVTRRGIFKQARQWDQKVVIQERDSWHVQRGNKSDLRRCRGQ